MSVCITAVSSYNLCLSLPAPACAWLACPALCSTGAPWSQSQAARPVMQTICQPGQGRVTCLARAGCGHVTSVLRPERGLRHASVSWGLSVCGPGSRGLTAVTAVTLTGQPQLPQLPGPGSLAPSAWAGLCRPVVCRARLLRAASRSPDFDKYTRSLGQAVVTSSHGVRTEKRISEQVFIH